MMELMKNSATLSSNSERRLMENFTGKKDVSKESTTS
jgi:hypothetical protein